MITAKSKQRADPVDEAAQELWRTRVTVSARVIVIFTRQLSTMLKSGVPIIQGIETLSYQPEHPHFGEVIRQVCERLCAGHSLSHSLSQFPRVFPTIFVTMVQIGERTGALDHSLERMALWMERDYELRQKVRSALTYPVFVLALASVLTLGLFYYVLPGFITIFRDMNVELPWVTRFVIAITNAVRNPGSWILGLALGGGLLSLAREITRDPMKQRRCYSLFMLIPVLGPLLRYGSLARYCASVETMLATGMDIPKTFRLAASASGNPLLSHDADALVESIMEGRSASEHMLAHPKLYPGSMVQMVLAGEQSSKMPEMFRRASDYYNIEMNYQVQAMSAALEPLLLAGVAGVVGTIVVSVFLPLYSYLGNLGT